MKTLTNKLDLIILSLTVITILSLITYNIVVNGVINYISFNGI